MQLTELKQALKEKSLEFEWSMEHGIPHAKLREIYKELKELQYQIVQAELQQTQFKTSCLSRTINYFFISWTDLKL